MAPASLKPLQCTDNITTYIKHPADTPHPAAEVEPFSPANQPAFTPNVPSHWDEFYNKFPCMHMASLTQPTVTSTTHMTTHAATVIATSDSMQPSSPSTTVTSTESGTHTTITAHLTVLEAKIHSSNWTSPQMYPTNVTFNHLTPMITVMNTLPNSTSKDTPPIEFKLTSIKQ